MKARGGIWAQRRRALRESWMLRFQSTTPQPGWHRLAACGMNPTTTCEGCPVLADCGAHAWRTGRRPEPGCVIAGVARWPMHRWDPAPLIAEAARQWRPSRVDGPTSEIAKAAERLGVTREVVFGWQRVGGPTTDTADEMACRLNVHPLELWPDWHAAYDLEDVA